MFITVIFSYRMAYQQALAAKLAWSYDSSSSSVQ